VREPQVFLMDEPLSNLDAKLRAQTRSEIRRLQREVGTTTVYVTHDQVEAMTMGDRIATMRDGVLEQVGDPDSVYAKPANTFVASFIGSPAMSLARAGCERGNGTASLVLGAQRVDLRTTDVPSDVIVGVRAEHARLWDAEADLLGPIDGRVDYVESLGRETLIGVAAADDARFVVEAEGHVRAEPGESLRFGFRPAGSTCSTPTTSVPWDACERGVVSRATSRVKGVTVLPVHVEIGASPFSIDQEEAEMALARVVEFEGVSKERMEEMDREMRDGERPENVPAKEIVVPPRARGRRSRS
jgi:multiple sugar transport system ATP-binding protein